MSGLFAVMLAGAVDRSRVQDLLSGDYLTPETRTS